VSYDFIGNANFNILNFRDPQNDFHLSVTLPSGFSIEDVAAVPEPSSWAMLLIGFAGIGSMIYRAIDNDIHGTCLKTLCTTLMSTLSLLRILWMPSSSRPERHNLRLDRGLNSESA